MRETPSHREGGVSMWIVFYRDDAGRDVRYGAYSLMEHGDDAMERLEGMGRRAGICHETQWEAR